MQRWTKPIAVMAAKAAIAEPSYVPSGFMELPLQIGDRYLT